MFRRINPLAVAAVALVLVVAGLVLLWPGEGKKYVVASFPRAVSLYEGSDVKILGVPVGKVESVVPSGTVVKVKLYYDAEHKVPADAKAVVVSPSVVGDRFVQLTPAYSGGDVMTDNAELGVDRTATPLELDEIFGALNDLNIALGPDGANRVVDGGVGPLTRLLDSTARNFGGQGAQFNTTLKNLGALTKTLADNKEEFFGTLEQVQEFTATLERNDQTVRAFNDSLAGGADLLADERQELAAVLRNLSVAMTEVRGFLRENRGALTRNIAGLNRISKVLVKRRDAVEKTLRYAPAALNNLFLAGNVKQGTLDTRDNRGVLFSNLERNPAEVLCSFLGEAEAEEGCPVIEDVLGDRSFNRAAPFGAGQQGRTVVPEPIDRSLVGILESRP
jgi:virulence factor Mce-like protein